MVKIRIQDRSERILTYGTVGWLPYLFSNALKVAKKPTVSAKNVYFCVK